MVAKGFFIVSNTRLCAIRCSSTRRLHPCLSNRRLFHDYAAVVAGSGPAGVAAVGNLLDKKIPGKVLWVDPQLAAGKLNETWRQVPSNTKVNLFVEFAKALEPFRQIIEKSPTPNAITALESLEQESGCPISYAADMCLMLTKGLCNFDNVDGTHGRVAGANWDASTSRWTVEVNPTHSSKAKTVAASSLVLCIGSTPNALPVPVPGLQIKRVGLETALAPTALSSALPKYSPATVAVIGASHSAILVLLNLYNLIQSSHRQLRVLWFTRNPLRYAEYKDGWVLRDNTGLKGEAAVFAKENLEDSKLSSSPVGDFVQKIDCSGDQEQEAYKKYFPDCTHIVQATGFSVNPLPMLTSAGEPIGSLQYDHYGGGFLDQNGNNVPGLYGAGIAFPERVTDPLGNVELNVGMFKFMKYLKRVAGDWIERSPAPTATSKG